jgi:hypothetical protein
MRLMAAVLDLGLFFIGFEFGVELDAESDVDVVTSAVDDNRLSDFSEA